MMNKILVNLDPKTTKKISKRIAKNLKKHNESLIGPYEFKSFTIHITDELGDIIGGIKGEILHKVCMVQIVWVHKNHRLKGLGTRLFRELENFVKEYNCTIIQLDTAEFQAKDFYEKIGFSVIATLPYNFKGYTTYIMRKML